MMKSVMTTTAVAVIFALTPYAAQAADWTFSDLDADGNRQLSESEFEQISSGAFDAWDADGNGRLTSEELYAGMFSSWDTDNNDRLNETEYRDGYTAWFAGDVEPSFAEIAGDDDTLAQDEFRSALRESDQLAGFDTGDEGLKMQAFHVALYDVYDGDGDQRLGEEEYAQFRATGDGMAADRQTAAGADGQADEQQIAASGDNERMSGDDQMAASDDGQQMSGDGEPAVGQEQTAAVGDTALQAEQVVAPADWDMEPFYANGTSVDYLIDDVEVYGADGAEIGSIENIVFSQDGQVLSLIAEVGGFWDMFDTHVNVPWDEVAYEDGRFMIPVTEQNVDDYNVNKTDYLTASEGEQLQEVEDDLLTGPRAFRASELIGDFARIRDGEDSFANFGYVNDLIIADGKLQTVVVRPDTGYGMGDAYGYGYPYYGNRWNPGGTYYDMPYGRQEVVEADQVEIDRFDRNRN